VVEVNLLEDTSEDATSESDNGNHKSRRLQPRKLFLQEESESTEERS
jgi:hypothetical protein